MPSDFDIARQFKPRPITTIAQSLGITKNDLTLFGEHIAKVNINALKSANKKGKLILVSATTPTASGEGKTTTTIGLGQAFHRLFWPVLAIGRFDIRILRVSGID